MNKWTICLSLAVLVTAFLLALALPGGQAEALPEYSAQTGEPRPLPGQPLQGQHWRWERIASTPPLSVSRADR